MMDLLSRRDRHTALLKAFSDGASNSTILQLLLYPGELVRLKKEFPELNFAVVDMHKTATSKRYAVEITRI